jgi:thiamine-phosphate pyrophosphorylase
MAQARRWAEMGVEFVQVREKQLAAGELVRLAAAMRAGLREAGAKTRLLVNGRAEVAVAAGADGVHLTSRAGEATAAEVRRVFAAAGCGEPVVSASCHTVAEVRRAVDQSVDLILFGPVFEKRVAGEVVVAGVGFEALREACAAADGASGIPVLALGGVTEENAGRCVEAGAAGVAGIRLFGSEAAEAGGDRGL